MNNDNQTPAADAASKKGKTGGPHIRKLDETAPSSSVEIAEMSGFQLEAVTHHRSRSLFKALETIKADGPDTAKKILADMCDRNAKEAAIKAGEEKAGITSN
ncbi:hypothetical protein OQA88_8029 [Cercophora sp. LCS_1]